MKIDLNEPYDIIADAREDVRKEFWKRALKIINGIYEEFWRRDVVALGKEKWMEGRLKGLDAFMTEDELRQRVEDLDIFHASILKEHDETILQRGKNERAT